MSDDPIEETRRKIGGYLTVALTAAARTAEVIAHRRAHRRAQQLREIGRTQWWDTAGNARSPTATRWPGPTGRPTRS